MVNKIRGSILQLDACPSFRMRINYLFCFLSLLFFVRSIAQCFASKKPVIKKTKKTMLLRLVKYFDKTISKGPVRESNPGPLAPEARIMPLDQQARRI